MAPPVPAPPVRKPGSTQDDTLIPKSDARWTAPVYQDLSQITSTADFTIIAQTPAETQERSSNGRGRGGRWGALAPERGGGFTAILQNTNFSYYQEQRVKTHQSKELLALKPALPRHECRITRNSIKVRGRDTAVSVREYWEEEQPTHTVSTVPVAKVLTLTTML